MAAADFRLMTEAMGEAIKNAILALPNATEAAAADATAAAAEARSAIAQLGGLVADTYSSSKTYAIGDYTYYDNKLYRCKTDITTAEAWTSAHWTRVKLGNDVSAVAGELSETNFLTNQNSLYVAGSVIKSDGTFTGGAYYCHLIYPVSDQETVYISGVTYGPTWPVCVFEDENHNVLSVEEGKSKYNHMLKVEIPEGTKYIYVNGNLSESEGVLIPCVADARYKDSIGERVRRLENCLSKFEIVTESEFKTGYAFKDDGTETAGRYYCYKKYQLNGAKYIHCSGYDYGSNWPLCVFLDANDDVVGNSMVRTSGANVVKAEIVPDGATQVCINGNMNDEQTQIEPKMFVGGSSQILEEIMRIAEEVKYDDIVLGSAYNYAGNTDTKGDFVYTTYKVAKDDVLIVNGRDFGTNWPLGFFVNASGVPIAPVISGSVSNDVLFAMVPENADRLVINGSMAEYKYPHIYRIIYRNLSRKDNLYTYETTKKKRYYSIREAFTKWLLGEKFPVCVLGDSTTDGYQTTGHTENEVGTDHQDPNTYTTKLQALLRQATGNNVLRIYNAGFSGKNATWALQNIDSIIWDNEYYSDSKIVIISHGINDYVADNANSVGNYEHALRWLIQNIFDHNAQPVLMTHQAGMENYGRFGWKEIAGADEITKKIAEEYNLEILDKNTFTNLCNIYSEIPISTLIPDGCHYGDAGHEFVAGWLFKEFVPYTIPAGDAETIISFADERIKTGLEYSSVTNYIWKDVRAITPSNGFKLEAYCSKNTATTLIDAWVFVEAHGKKTLKSYCTTPNAQTVMVDGTDYSISEAEQEITDLDVGLHHIVVTSAANSNVNYLGLKVN